MGSDGTADALYCEPHIAVLWLQWGGQMDTVCAPWPGIKTKENRQIEESTKNSLTGEETEQQLAIISTATQIKLLFYDVVFLQLSVIVRE